MAPKLTPEILKEIFQPNSAGMALKDITKKIMEAREIDPNDPEFAIPTNNVIFVLAECEDPAMLGLNVKIHRKEFNLDISKPGQQTGPIKLYLILGHKDAASIKIIHNPRSALIDYPMIGVLLRALGPDHPDKWVNSFEGADHKLWVKAKDLVGMEIAEMMSFPKDGQMGFEGVVLHVSLLD